ncbi:hypothetical protein ROHU_030557 [Labeo rohita]|uniref:Uncharacterized protein n=1 Tax=Labeo rohita TaxID=84645 RepID=A0A498LZB4_LABRO|nr:hypothetical protein ROHU_030557 [Labeo rohita]
MVEQRLLTRVVSLTEPKLTYNSLQAITYEESLSYVIAASNIKALNKSPSHFPHLLHVSICQTRSPVPDAASKPSLRLLLNSMFDRC